MDKCFRAPVTLVYPLFYTLLVIMNNTYRLICNRIIFDNNKGFNSNGISVTF